MDAEAHIPDDRHGRILAELAGLSLTLARDLQNRALEAKTTDEAARMAAAFHSVSRGLRQTLALELKVADFRRGQALDARRDAAAGLRPAPPAPVRTADPSNAALDKALRREAIRTCVHALVWSERERPEADEAEAGVPSAQPDAVLKVRLEDLLDVMERRDDFAQADLEDQILIACGFLGLDFDSLEDDDSEVASQPRPEPALADTG